MSVQGLKYTNTGSELLTRHRDQAAGKLPRTEKHRVLGEHGSGETQPRSGPTSRALGLTGATFSGVYFLGEGHFAPLSSGLLLNWSY